MGWLWGLFPMFNIFFSYLIGEGRRKPSSRQTQCQTYVLFDCLQLLEPTEIYLGQVSPRPSLVSKAKVLLHVLEGNKRTKNFLTNFPLRGSKEGPGLSFVSLFVLDHSG